MLQWMDIFKLFLPFGLSVLLFVFKDWYAKRKEIKTKQEATWRLLKEEVNTLRDEISQLIEFVNAYNDGLQAGFTPDIDSTIRNTITRLSDLNPKNTYVYANYISKHARVENHMLSLDKLVTSLITTPNINEERTINAVKSQTFALMDSLSERAVASNAVLEVIIECNRFNRNFDAQTIRASRDGLDKENSRIKKFIEANYVTCIE